jgi:hypothetical protein
VANNYQGGAWLVGGGAHRRVTGPGNKGKSPGKKKKGDARSRAGGGSQAVLSMIKLSSPVLWI